MSPAHASLGDVAHKLKILSFQMLIKDSENKSFYDVAEWSSNHKYKPNVDELICMNPKLN